MLALIISDILWLRRIHAYENDESSLAGFACMVNTDTRLLSDHRAADPEQLEFDPSDGYLVQCRHSKASGLFRSRRPRTLAPDTNQGHVALDGCQSESSSSTTCNLAESTVKSTSTIYELQKEETVRQWCRSFIMYAVVLILGVMLAHYLHRLVIEPRIVQMTPMDQSIFGIVNAAMLVVMFGGIVIRLVRRIKSRSS